MCLLRTENIAKIYNKGKENECKALDGVSITIETGESVAIMGESGSGKSTLLHILGGLDFPTSGKVYYNDKVLSDKIFSKLATYRNSEIGFVLQNYGLILSESVIDNICVPVIFSGNSLKSGKKRALEILKNLGMDKIAGKEVSKLSGGQKQRVAIARALINDPKIILADEPTGALDSKNSNEIMEILLSLNNQGRTIIVVTHDENVAKHCRRIIKISDGKVITELMN